MLLSKPTPTTPTSLIDFWGGLDVTPLFVRNELQNMRNGLLRHMRPERVQEAMLEAFAMCLTDWAEETGRPICVRFAFEQALRRQSYTGTGIK